MRACLALMMVAAAALAGCGGGDDGGSGGDAGGGGGGGGGIDAPPATGSDAALIECVNDTNADRAKNGKPALTRSAQLEAYAATGAMTDYNSMSAHSHFGSTSGGGIAFAENECPGFEGWNLGQGGGTLVGTIDACVQAFYAEGPGSDYSSHGHYINMMGDYGTLGCGIFEATNGDVTIVQDYGQ